MEVSKKKLYLIPVGPELILSVEKKKIPLVRVNPSSKTMFLTASAITEMDIDKKWIRTFVDQANKVIAWKVSDHLTDEQMGGKEWKYCEKNSAGTITVGVARELRALGLAPDKPLKYEVKKTYLNNDSMLEDGVAYFIELASPFEDDKKAETKII